MLSTRETPPSGGWADHPTRPDAHAASLPSVAVPAVLALASGQILPLDRDGLTIGRAPTNDIVIDDPLIAAEHARLQRLPVGWVLTDLVGGKSTTVNGQPLSRPVFLAPGDTVR